MRLAPRPVSGGPKNRHVIPSRLAAICCPLMWHLPRFVWLIRHALSRDPSLSFAFQSL